MRSLRESYSGRKLPKKSVIYQIQKVVNEENKLFDIKKK